MSDKTKLGLSASVLCAICYFMVGVSTWFVIALAITLLLIETNREVKEVAIQAALLSIVFLVIALGWSSLTSVFSLFDLEIYTFERIVRSLISIIENIIVLLAGIFTLIGKPVSIPVLSSIAKKSLDNAQ